MKKIILASLLLLISVSIKAQDANKVAAVNKTLGIDVYMDCRPTESYETLGEVSVKICSPYNGCRDKLIEKAKETFPTTDAVIILEISCSKIARAECIHYKVKEKETK